MKTQADSYHAHVYFNETQVALASELHERARHELGTFATIWPMRMRPVGPHHAPMFEIEFPHASRDRVIAWVRAHHGPLPVLLHPETGDVLGDHRDRAVWLGRNLGLKLDVLERHEKGQD